MDEDEEEVGTVKDAFCLNFQVFFPVIEFMKENGLLF